VLLAIPAEGAIDAIRLAPFSDPASAIDALHEPGRFALLRYRDFAESLSELLVEAPVEDSWPFAGRRNLWYTHLCLLDWERIWMGRAGPPGTAVRAGGWGRAHQGRSRNKPRDRPYFFDFGASPENRRDVRHARECT